MKFEVVIATGNEAMQTTEDAAAALRDVAERLDAGYLEGSILDANGNTVGSFTFEGG